MGLRKYLKYKKIIFVDLLIYLNNIVTIFKLLKLQGKRTKNHLDTFSVTYD